MTRHNAQNERIKRSYLTYLKEAKRLSETSVDNAAAALYRFETYTRFRDFRQFRVEQAMGFKRRLLTETNERTGKPLSKATVHSVLAAQKSFFQWLAGQPGYKSRLAYSDAEYFNLTDKETRQARTHTPRPVPTIEHIQHTLGSMSADTEIEKRNRALVAFTLLTGARDGAIASFKLKHVDLVEGRVMHDAREVNTKFSKSFPTFFFPVGAEARQIVEDWVEFLRMEKLWGNEDPLFPATEISLGNNRHFRASGLTRRHWTTASPIRDIFRQAFASAGLPYYNPHSFRNTLSLLGAQRCRSPEEYKAWSQNLGHEDVMTTLNSYGNVSAQRQREVILKLGQSVEPDTSNEALVEQFRQIAAQLSSGS